jgi:hypothetical protein
MKGVPSTPGTHLPIPKELKGPVAITRYAALHLPTAEYLCHTGQYNPGSSDLYRLFGSPEKGKRSLKTTSYYENLKLSGGTVLNISGPSSKKAIVINQFDFIKLFTFIKFPNGDKLLRMFIKIPVGYILKDSSCLKQTDLDYFKQHPERVVYETE